MKPVRVLCDASTIMVLVVFIETWNSDTSTGLVIVRVRRQAASHPVISKLIDGSSSCVRAAGVKSGIIAVVNIIIKTAVSVFFISYYTLPEKWKSSRLIISLVVGTLYSV